MRSPTLGFISGLAKKYGEEFALELFRRANFSKLFELEVKNAFDSKRIEIPIYLSIGTEFNSAALSMVLKNYNIFAQHRCHATYLSFGGKPKALRDELFGLPSGCSRGMSGSNAIQSPEKKMFGHSGLMGEQVPIAVGAALASKTPSLTICGDASVEEDYIYPSLGFAATKKLPVLFICEDNGLSILTSVTTRRNWSPVAVAESLGIPSVDISDDPWLIAHHAKKMSENLPGFINIRCVRHFWHAGTGIDNEPEWNRYELVLDELVKLGLKKRIIEVEKINSNKVKNLWRKKINGKNNS